MDFPAREAAGKAVVRSGGRVADETVEAAPPGGVALSLMARGDGFVALRAVVSELAPPVTLRAIRMADGILLALRAAENPGLVMTPPLTEAAVPLERGFVDRLAVKAGQVAASAASRAIAAIAAQPALSLPEAQGAAAALLQAARESVRAGHDREPARIAAAAEIHAALYFTLRHAQQQGLLAPAAEESA